MSLEAQRSTSSRPRTTPAMALPRARQSSRLRPARVSATMRTSARRARRKGSCTSRECSASWARRSSAEQRRGGEERRRAARRPPRPRRPGSCQGPPGQTAPRTPRPVWLGDMTMALAARAPARTPRPRRRPSTCTRRGAPSGRGRARRRPASPRYCGHLGGELPRVTGVETAGDRGLSCVRHARSLALAPAGVKRAYMHRPWPPVRGGLAARGPAVPGRPPAGHSRPFGCVSPGRGNFGLRRTS